ncbi:MAG: hypothetical protein IKD18_00425 [Clostridia bacterium]|nr:hypothetical protein [Clostridia bacterium]
MKLTKNGILLFAGILFSLVMAFFTFFAWGWFSDRGFRFYFEVPIRTESGLLATLVDAASAIAPFLLILAFVLMFSGAKDGTRLLSRFLAVIPMTFASLLQILRFLTQEEEHFTLAVTALFLILSGALTVASCFAPELGRFAGQIALAHAGLETVLVVISAVFQEKYSQFYFSQLLPMGRYSNFRYSFFVISFFLAYVSYSLALFFLHSLGDGEKPFFIKKAPAVKTPLPEEEEIPSEESEEENTASLSLEDFGIEK